MFIGMCAWVRRRRRDYHVLARFYETFALVERRMDLFRTIPFEAASQVMRAFVNVQRVRYGMEPE